LGEVEVFAVGFEDAAFAALLDGDACYIGVDVVEVAVVFEGDFEGVWHYGIESLESY
jgi:hypothetical protein